MRIIIKKNCLSQYDVRVTTFFFLCIVLEWNSLNTSKTNDLSQSGFAKLSEDAISN